MKIIQDIETKDIEKTLLKIKDICLTVLLKHNPYNPQHIKDKIKQVAYSPNTDIVYIYVQGVDVAKVLMLRLKVMLEQNNLSSDMSIEVVGDIGVIELEFCDEKMIAHLKKCNLKDIITLKTNEIT